MFIRQRLKYMRKYDSDLWGFLYNRRRKNMFFQHFRLSLINRLISFFKPSKHNHYRRIQIFVKHNKNPLIKTFNFSKIKIYKFFRSVYVE